MEMNCEICIHQGAKYCEECMDKLTGISFYDVKQLVKKLTKQHIESKYVKKSWGDCDPGYENITHNIIDPDDFIKALNNFKKH